MESSLEIRAVLLIFLLELEIFGVVYREYIKTAQWNNFEAVLTTFCCYDYGDNASEAVQ